MARKKVSVSALKAFFEAKDKAEGAEPYQGSSRNRETRSVSPNHPHDGDTRYTRCRTNTDRTRAPKYRSQTVSSVSNTTSAVDGTMLTGGSFKRNQHTVSNSTHRTTRETRSLSPQGRDRESVRLSLVNNSPSSNIERGPGEDGPWTGVKEGTESERQRECASSDVLLGAGADSWSSDSPTGFVAPYCTERVVEEEDGGLDDEGDQPDADVAAAFVYSTKMWRGRTELKVYFMDLNVLKGWRVNQSPMTPEVILGWAKEWNTELADAIPRFAKEDSKNEADIRVGFGRGGGCWSKVGTDAMKVLDKNKPTMNLVLRNYPSDFQRYLVIHEFGHVLGLMHEHQRSDFWGVASKFLDPAKMENDSRMRFVDFVTDIWGLSRIEGEEVSAYDPESVMHYWFDVNWFYKKFDKYRNLNNVKNSKRLNSNEKKVLLGIHKNSTFAERPSKMDLTFLQNQYKKRGSFVDIHELPHSPRHTSGPVFFKTRSCSECSTKQQALLDLVRKQLDSLFTIRSVDHDCLNTVAQHALLECIDRFSKTDDLDFAHLKGHLESLYRKERVLVDSALLDWALQQVEKKMSERNGDACPDIFCEDTLYHASLCCLALERCRSDSCQRFFQDQREIRGHSLSEVTLSVTSEERYLVAKQGEHTYYIAFKGNTDIQEWPEQYSSFSNGIIAQANNVPLSFFVDLLTDQKNRVVITGFCFGGLLASYLTTKLWQYPSLGWEHLQKSLVCITFAQPHLPIPELGSFAHNSPEIAKSIHSIYYDQDKIPLVISLLDQKNSCLLVMESSSEPGLHMSVHEEPRTAFEDPLTLKLISELGRLMKSFSPEEDECQEELKETLGSISPVRTPLERSYSDYFTHHSLCTKHDRPGLTFTEMPSQEMREKTSHFTLKDVDSLLMNYKKHTMQDYASLLRGYLDKHSYTIPNSHDAPKTCQLVEPKFKEIEMSESSSTLSLTVNGESLWFCTEFRIEHLEPELDFAVTLAKNSGTSIKAKHPSLDNSALDTVPNGKELRVCVNSQFCKPQKTRVPLLRKEYAQAARKRHIDDLKPSQLLELVYLSTLLERHPHGHFSTSKSNKFYVVEDFIEKSQKVVPLEAIGTAIKSANEFVSSTCATVVLKHRDSIPYSEELTDLALARENIKKRDSPILKESNTSLKAPLQSRSRSFSRQSSRSKRNGDCVLCGVSTAFLYPECFPASPLEELQRARQTFATLVTNDYNHPGNTMFKDKSEVASVVAELRQKCLAICVALLGEYLERQKILVQHGALPKLHDLTEERKLELLSKGEPNETFVLETTLLTNLVDRPYAAEVEYSFLLESRVAKLFEERGVGEDYPLDSLIASWKTILKSSPLTLIVDSHIPVMARWLKWGLMVNNLRKEIVNSFPPAIGVVGLVNSGKTRLVHTLFGIKVSSGTTEKTRTTIPFIYNLKETVGEVDIVDFPGVDDIDDSVKDVATLILTLAQVIIYVVDYRSVNTKVSKDWLHTLQAKEVPMLLCLTHADKFYAEHMTYDGQRCQHPDVNIMKKNVKNQLKQMQLRGLNIPPSVTVKFCTISQDKDSIFVDPENRQRLVDVGIDTPKSVGEWIANTLEKRLGKSSLAFDLRRFFENQMSYSV